MTELKLIVPTLDYRDQILEYKNEFIKNSDSLDGTAGLANAVKLEDWFAALQDNASEKTVRSGLVPASTFLGIRVQDNKIVGMIDIRRRLNDYLLEFGGNIGYSIRKSERKKGYAKEMLRLALEKCKELHLAKVLITCSKSNIASAKTIIGNGGILENEVPDGDGITQRYWIELI